MGLLGVVQAVPLRYEPSAQNETQGLQACAPVVVLKLPVVQASQVLSVVPPQVLDNCNPGPHELRHGLQVRSLVAVGANVSKNPVPHTRQV